MSRAHQRCSLSKTETFLDQDTFPLIYDRSSWNGEHKQLRNVLRSTPQPTLKSGTNHVRKHKEIGPTLRGAKVRQTQRNARSVARMRRKIGMLEHALDALHIGLIVQSLDGNVRLVTSCAIQQLRSFLGHEALRRNSVPETLFAWVKRQHLASLREGKVASRFVPVVLQRREKSLVIRSATNSDQMSLLLEENPTLAQPVRRCGLSRRETQVLDWVSQGRTNKEIAVILGLSPRTVQKHLEHMYKKLNVTTRTAAAGKLYHK